MKKINVRTFGRFSVKCNVDFILIASIGGEQRVLYSSFYDFKTVIDKINSDIKAVLKFSLIMKNPENKHWKDWILEIDKDFNERRIFKQTVKETSRVHLVLTTLNESVCFYNEKEELLPQLKGFLINKHRLLLSDEDLMEIVEKYGVKAERYGHNDIGLRAMVFNIADIKKNFLISDPEFLPHINNSIDFIRENSDQFRDALKKNVKVLYDKNNTYNIEKYMVKPFEGQEVLWGAGIEVLKRDNFLYVAADMGLGKTLSSLFINDQTHTQHRKKEFYTTLIVAPTTTMRGKDGGWKKEIQDIMTTADGEVRPHKVIMITSEEGSAEFMRVTNEINFKKPDKNYFIVVSKEVLKLSYNREPQYNVKDLRKVTDMGRAKLYKGKKVVTCPDCGAFQTYTKNEYWSTEDLFFSQGKAKKRVEQNKSCVRCGSQLFGAYSNKKTKPVFHLGQSQSNYSEEQLEVIERIRDTEIRKYQASKKMGLYKISIVDYMKMKKLKFDSVIIDEVHEGNKIGSIISRAQVVALKHGKKKIVLSGTSNAGYASNMYSILRATMSKKLKEKGLTGEGFMKRFVSKYGILERVFKEEYTTKGKSEKKTDEIEREGISSAMFTDFLAENYIFFTYKDIRKKMVDIKEEYIPLQQNYYVTDIVDEFSKEIQEVNIAEYGMYKDSIVKHLVNHPNSSWTGELSVSIPFSKEKELIPLPCFEEDFSFENGNITPKDTQLIEIIKEELALKRKVCVFSYFSGGNTTKKYMQGEPVTDRLRKMLEVKGFRVAHLTRDRLLINGKSIKTSSGDRQVRLHEEQNNYDILITNPKIVNVGINLRFIPTYVNYMPSYDVSGLSQANRRGYRINTEVENKIYHLYYENTVEKEIIERFQTKRLESKAMEGVFDVNIESEKEDKLRSHSKSVNKLVKELEDMKIS